MQSELGYIGDVVALDLDDTLYPEAQYVVSGRKAVSRLVESMELTDACNALRLMETAVAQGLNPFDALADDLTASIPDREAFIAACVQTYRFHAPQIAPYPDAAALLRRLNESGTRMVIITDGSVKRQMAKIKALGIERFFAPQDIFISEAIGSDKTGITPWQMPVRRYPNARRFIYIGDNPAKDFLMPNRLGWITVGRLDNGENIHPQTAGCAPQAQPQHWTRDFNDIERLWQTI